MKIKMIAAVTSNLCLGKDNDLVIKSPKDMEFFKTQTKDNALIYGRKTFDSIGRPLPGRPNIVITSDPEKFLANCKHGDSLFAVSSKEEALAIARRVGLNVSIIGGASIYEMFAPDADILWLTKWEVEVEGDTFLTQATLDHFNTETKVRLLGATHNGKTIKGHVVGLAKTKEK